MRQSVADVGITDVCMPRELAPAAVPQRNTSVRQHLAYTGRVLIHPGGLVGDAPMLKKLIARLALCARRRVALSLRPDMGERNAC
jgi:hypothetical protein